MKKWQALLTLFLVPKIIIAASLPDFSKDIGGVFLYLGTPDDESFAELTELSNSKQWSGQILTKDAQAAKKLSTKLSSHKDGSLSVRSYNGYNLPVVNNLINKVICADSARVPKEELMRIIAPRGQAYFPNGKDWKMENMKNLRV